jgi:nitroreductase
MTYPFIPYQPIDLGAISIGDRAQELRTRLSSRRSVRDFAGTPVPKDVIEDLIMTASSAPSGANKQPWTFCAVSDPGIKRQIRIAAEKEEHENYHGRMSEEWLQDLAPLMTDWQKPFLEIAPWLIVVFKKAYDLDGDRKRKNYYVSESVGLACGFLLAATHNAGLVALTHTPSPMNFLQEILDRPENERPFLLIPVGYPAPDAKVPDIRRKTPEEVIVYYE